MSEVDSTSIEKINESSGSTNNDVDTSLDSRELFLYATPSIDSSNSEILRATGEFETLDFIPDLNGEFPGGEHNQEFDPVVGELLLLSHPDNAGQSKGQGFPRARPVFGNHIESIPDDVEGFILDGEKLVDSLFPEGTHHVFILDEPGELAFVGVAVLSTHCCI